MAFLSIAAHVSQNRLNPVLYYLVDGLLALLASPVRRLLQRVDLLQLLLEELHRVFLDRSAILDKDLEHHALIEEPDDGLRALKGVNRDGQAQLGQRVRRRGEIVRLRLVGYLQRCEAKVEAGAEHKDCEVQAHQLCVAEDAIDLLVEGS